MPSLASLDLNLLLVLHTVLEEGSATKAAQKLHVTQSAVSNSLARLRAAFGDPLVVRSGAGLVPTPRAEQLAPLLAAALERLQAAVDAPALFDPKASPRCFTLACADPHEVVLVPSLIERMAAKMPHASLRGVTVDYLVAQDGLASGTVDAWVGDPTSTPPGCLAEELFEDDAVCLVRRDHPFTKARMSPKELASWSHVVAEPGRERDWLEIALRAEGLAATTVLMLPHFTSAALAVTRTDHVALSPRRLARALVEVLPLRIVEVHALDLPRFTTSLVWHARTDADAAARFFRDLIREIGHAKRRSRRR